MKYYTISRSDNLNEIGYYPQTELFKSYNPRAMDSHWQVHPHEFPDFTPNYELELNKKALPTNYLHAYDNRFGMVIDSKFKSILKKFKLPPHRFYPIKVYHKKEKLEYFWFHYIVKDFWEFLDKQESKAVIYDDNKNFEAIKDLSLNLDPEEYKNLEYFELPFYQHLRWEKIVFNNDYPNYDLYKTMSFGLNTFLSDNLIKALNEAGMTGFEAIPYDKIVSD